MIKTCDINALYLATVPFIAIYDLPIGINLNWVLVGLLLILNLKNLNIPLYLKSRRNEIMWLAALLVIGLMGTVYNTVYDYFDTTLYYHNLFAIVIFFIPLILMSGDCNVSLFKKVLYVCGIAASVICIFQRIQLLLTGHFEVDVFIPGLIVDRDLDTFTKNRVSAFFTEPAHLSIYLLPIFNLALYEKKIIQALLFAVGILFSGSTTGFLLLFAIALIYLVKSGVKKRYLILAVLLAAVLFCLVNIYFPDVFADNIEKLNETDSSSVRHLGPLSYIKYMDIGQIFVGIGLNELEGFLKSNGIFGTNYANAVIYSFLCYGLLGFLACVKYFYDTIRDNRSNWGFVVFALGILLSDQVLFNRNLLYLVVFLIFSRELLGQGSECEQNEMSDL